MIIDADCHISSSRFDNLAITADDLIERMDTAGIDKALIWLKPPYNKDIAPENKAVYDAANKYPGRFLALGWANPLLGHKQTLDTIKQCFEEYGFLGIKFNGAQDDYVIDDDKVSLSYIEAAARYGKPIAFHIGADFYENTHPYRMGTIAQKFSNVQMLMVHMGGAGMPSLAKAAIETCLANKNISIIASAIGSHPILNAINTLGADRVCFGSDSPFGIMHVELARFNALLKDYSTQDIEKVMGGNITRLFQV